MTLPEKALLHQIHPTKLLTDFLSSIFAIYLFWKHNLVLGIIVTIVPPLLISLFLVTFVNLNRYKKSKMGHLIKKYMSPLSQTTRVLGFIIISVGAWQQKQWLILLGLIFILPAWGYGWILYKLHLSKN